MEEKGDIRSGAFGPEGSAGLPPRTPGACTPGPGVSASWRQRAAYCWMQMSYGVKEGHGHSRATQGTGPLESSLENPLPRPPVSKSVLSTLSVRG